MEKFLKSIAAILLVVCMIMMAACSSGKDKDSDADNQQNSGGNTPVEDKTENDGGDEDNEKVPEDAEDEEPVSEYVGVWESVKVVVGEEELSADEVESMGVKTTLTIYPDGTLTMVNKNVNREGTWAEEDGKILVSADGYEVHGELSGGTLVMAESDGTITFERTGDAPEK